MSSAVCASPALILMREDRIINYDVFIAKERTYLQYDLRHIHRHLYIHVSTEGLLIVRAQGPGLTTTSVP
jgi:hypothetical protein